MTSNTVSTKSSIAEDRSWARWLRLVAFLFGTGVKWPRAPPKRTEDTHTSNGPRIRTRPTDRRNQTDIHFQRTVRPPTDANVERTEEPQRTYLSTTSSKAERFWKTKRNGSQYELANERERTKPDLRQDQVLDETSNSSTDRQPVRRKAERFRKTKRNGSLNELANKRKSRKVRALQRT